MPAGESRTDSRADEAPRAEPPPPAGAEDGVEARARRVHAELVRHVRTRAADGRPLTGERPDPAARKTVPPDTAVPRDVAHWLTERRLLAPDGLGVSSPERALSDLIAGHGSMLRAAFAGLERDVRALEDVLRMLPAPRAPGHRAIEAEFFEDRDRLRRRLDNFHPLTRDEMLCMRPSFPGPEVLERSLATDLEVLSKGVTFRMLVSGSALRRPGAGRYLSALAEAGAEVRVAASCPLNLMVIDRELTVMWAGLGPDRGSGDVALHGPLIASCFTQVFDHNWDAAAPHTPAAAGRAAASDDYTAQEREVLALLATGAKDESIARRLGVSERTLRRLMTQLVEKLGVESRFAAGVRAARLGLVD